MADPTTSGSNSSGEELRLLIERIERLELEKKGKADDIRDVYAEGKARGFDTRTMRSVIRERKLDKHVREERNALFETYMGVLGLL